MANFLILSTLLSLVSCATTLNDRIKDGEVRIGPMLDLSRSSYLKGCTDNSEVSFAKCVEKAKKHEVEIKEILSQ
jgi:hypothetical protein